MTGEIGDGALVARVLGGDVGSYAVLVRKYRDRYSRFAVRMLGNHEDAEEALQDAFVRAYRSLASCDDPERFGSWLYQILVNQCRTLGAKRGRRGKTFVIDEDSLSNASVEPTDESTAFRSEIEHALSQLVPDQREAFILKHVEELSYEEMSEMTGEGISTLKMRVKRACDRLKVLLEGVYP